MNRPSSGLVTLYEMIPFNAKWFMVMNSSIGKIEGRIEIQKSNSKGLDGGGKQLAREYVESQTTSLLAMRPEFETSLFYSSVDMVDRIVKDLKSVPPSPKNNS
jgi:hypothetical protein